MYTDLDDVFVVHGHQQRFAAVIAVGVDLFYDTGEVRRARAFLRRAGMLRRGARRRRTAERARRAAVRLDGRRDLDGSAIVSEEIDPISFPFLDCESTGSLGKSTSVDDSLAFIECSPS